MHEVQNRTNFNLIGIFNLASHDLNFPLSQMKIYKNSIYLAEGVCHAVSKHGNLFVVSMAIKMAFNFEIVHNNTKYTCE